MLVPRVLLQNARLIVLDDPFNAIDKNQTSADLLALVSAGMARAVPCWRAARHGAGALPFPVTLAAGVADRWPLAPPRMC